LLRRFALPLLCAAAVVALGPPPASSAPGTRLLPNLRPLPAGELQLLPSGTRRTLRFSMVTQNLGAGPLELRASGGAPVGAAGPHRLRLPLAPARGFAEALPRTAVRQRIYLEGGGHLDRPAGDFVFHPAHDHVHFEDFALYELVALDGAPAAPVSASKVTFCILDYAPAAAPPPGAPRAAVYGACGPAGGIADAVQGLSVGWGDYYDWLTPGQELDVTGLPDGLYALRTTADPLDRLTESDERDNASETRLRLAGGSLAPP
jgi:hypothetical protein